MKTERTEFLGQVFAYEKEGHQWTLTLKRSAIATQDLEELRILELHHPMFLEGSAAWDSDSVCFTYLIKERSVSYEELQTKSFSEKLRFSLNVLDLQEVLPLPLTFFLAPENLFVTKDLKPLLAYRGLPEVMVPQQIDADDFLRQVKCVIYTLFTNASFTDLYKGSLEVINSSAFLTDVRSAASLEELAHILGKNFDEKLAEEQARLTLVSKTQYKLYKFASIWLSVGLVLLLVPLIYLIFVQQPFKEKMLQADTAFIKVNYAEVIEELERVSLEQLPYTQKYELAYSYIQGFDFSDEQRTIILNNISLKSDELYLDYWIEVGRGNLDQAIDIAKRLDDTDVIIYALVQKMTEVRENTALSGKEREEALAALEAEKEKYLEERTTILVPDTSSSSVSEAGDGETTSSSSSGTTGSSSKE